jgi:transcriptional regulator with XRE-family HTH domain
MAKKIPKPVDAHVGALVRARRRELGISQTKLAEAVGLTFQQIQKYENGTNRLGSSRLMQIANALDVLPAYFFEDAPGATRKSNKKSDSTDYVEQFATSKDGLALIRAFRRVSKATRRDIVNLVARIAENQ